MATESYIERLQREKAWLLDAIRKTMGWHAAMLWAETTGRKGDAYKAADKCRVEMNEAIHKIEPILAEGDTK